MNIKITKKFKFEAAHALYGYDGKCKDIHGHSYKLFVTLMVKIIEKKGNPKLGMVMDLGDLEKIVKDKIVNCLDHSLIINADSPHKILGEQLASEGHKIIFFDYQPTSENMVKYIVDKIKNEFPIGIKLYNVELSETETSSISWNLQDQL